MHLAALPDGRFIIWNGDSSLVELLSPLPDDDDSSAD
jgi:hypothetical protein